MHGVINLEDDGYLVKTKREVKYLDVILDHGMTRTPHIDYDVQKAARTICSLAKSMPRADGPTLCD